MANKDQKCPCHDEPRSCALHVYILADETCECDCSLWKNGSEVGKTSRGYTIWREPNKDIGGYDYISDAVSSGYCPVNALVGLEELELIVKDIRSQQTCTCGSGGHPRHCAKHPERYDLHCADLDKGGVMDDAYELAVAITLAGHYDTCSHALSKNYACSCPVRQAEEVIEDYKPGGNKDNPGERYNYESNKD